MLNGLYNQCRNNEKNGFMHRLSISVVVNRWSARKFRWSAEKFKSYLQYCFINLTTILCNKVLYYVAA